jgi:threonine synthase
MKEGLAGFEGGYATEQETSETIRKVYEAANYIMDTHTAVASHVYYTKAKDKGRKTVIASTASPYKFTRSVMDAIDKEKYDKMTDFELVDELNEISGVKVPGAIEEIRTAPVLHDLVCDKSEMQKTVEKILGL